MHSEAKKRGLCEYAIQALLLVALLACAFPGTFMRAELISPAEILFQIPPWQDYAPEGFDQPRNPIMADILTLFHPWYAATRACLDEGEWPLWNPNEFAGVPLLANYQSAVFYPPRLLHAFLDLHLATTLYILLKIWLCGMAAYCCARVMKLGVPASRLFSVAWALASYNLIWCNWCLPDLSPWLAVLFMGAELTFQGRYRRGFFATTLGGVLLLLAGHPVTAMTMMLGLGLYFVLRLVFERRRGGNLVKPLALWAGAWVVILLACSVQLLPFLEYMANAYKGDGLAAYGSEPGLPLGAAVTFWLPRFFGTAADGNYWGDLDSNRYSMIYPGIAVWLGVALLASKQAWKEKGGRLGALLVACIVCILLTFEAPPFNMLNELPLFSTIKRSYYICFATFALPLLGAIGLDRWLAGERRVKELLPVLIGGGLVTGFIYGTASFNGALISMQKLNAYLGHQYLAGGLFFALGVGALLGSKLWARPKVWGTLLTILLAADLLMASHGLNPTQPREDILPDTELTSYLRNLERPCRVGFSEGGIPGGIMSSYGIEEWLGEDGMYPARMWTFLRGLGEDFWVAAEPGCSIQYYLKHPDYDAAFPLDEPGRFTMTAEFNGLEVYRNERALPRAYVVGTVEKIQDPEVLFERMKDPAFDPAALALVEDWDSGAIETTESSGQPSKAPTNKRKSGTDPGSVATGGSVPSFLRGSDTQPGLSQQLHRYPASGTAEVVERSSTRVAIKATVAGGEGILVLTDAFYPGWRVIVDGTEARLFPVNHVFRGVTLSEGDHSVVFEYSPTGFRAGLGLSVATLILGAVAAGLSIAHARRARLSH